MFEDKIIDYISPSGNRYKGRVVSCVKDIGITIVHADDPNWYLSCLIMKNAPNFYKAKGQITKTRKLFTERRKGIIKGVVDLSSLEEAGGIPSHSSCPFGQ